MKAAEGLHTALFRCFCTTHFSRSETQSPSVTDSKANKSELVKSTLTKRSILRGKHSSDQLCSILHTFIVVGPRPILSMGSICPREDGGTFSKHWEICGKAFWGGGEQGLPSAFVQQEKPLQRGEPSDSHPTGSSWLPKMRGALHG